MSPQETQESQDPKEQHAPKLPFPHLENEQELYLQHLMNMMVNVMDRGFQKS